MTDIEPVITSWILLPMGLVITGIVIIVVVVIAIASIVRN